MVTPTPPSRDRAAGWLSLLSVWSVGLFVVSAGVSTLLAYDPFTAAWRLASLLFGLGICGLLVLAGRRGWAWLLTGVSYAAAPVALALGIWSRFAGPNEMAAVAGALALLLPLQTAGVLLAHLRRQHPTVELLGSAWVLSVWLLLLSGERTAWLAVVLGVITAVLVGSRPPERFRQVRQEAGAGWIGVLVILGAVYVTFIVGSPLLTKLAPALPADLTERTALWQQMLGLAGDYRFTGSGLGMTAMVASSYLFLLHVPLFYHAHNTLIQVALEQGTPGALALVGMVVGAVGLARHAARQPDRQSQVVGVCGLAAVVIGVAHGLLDSELYASVWVPIFFLPLGYSWGAYAYSRQSTSIFSSPDSFHWGLRVFGMTALTAVAGLGLWMGLGGRAAWDANLGAVAQTRVELSVYHWPEWGWQDQVRRLPTVNLEPAEELLHAALAENADNLTALRRLGQIALSRGDFAQAQRLLLVAYQVNPQDRLVRQLLGECYALDGELSDAVRMWQDIDVTHDQLGLRQAWYQALGNSRDLQRMQEAIERYERGHAPP